MTSIVTALAECDEDHHSYLHKMKGPEDKVAAAEHALFDANPQQRYMVVGDAAPPDRTMRSLLHRLLELGPTITTHGTEHITCETLRVYPDQYVAVRI